MSTNVPPTSGRLTASMEDSSLPEAWWTRVCQEIHVRRKLAFVNQRKSTLARSHCLAKRAIEVVPIFCNI